MLKQTVIPLLLVLTLLFELGVSTMELFDTIVESVELPLEKDKEEKREADIDIFLDFEDKAFSNFMQHLLLNDYINIHVLMAQQHYAEIPDPPPDSLI